MRLAELDSRESRPRLGVTDSALEDTSDRWAVLPIGWLVAIVLVAVPLRLVRMTDSLWYDEVWSTRVILDSAGTLLVHTFVDLHPPLYSVVMFLWIRLFGDSDIAVRLPPLIFALASIPLSYAVAARFAGRSTGLITALFLCLSPVHIWYSTEARPYAFGLFLVLLATHSYYETRTAPERAWPLRIYAASVLAMVFTHYFLITYVVVFTVLTLSRPFRNRDSILRVNIAAFVTFATFFAIKYVVAPLPTDLPHLRPFTLSELYQLFFNWFPLGDVHGTVLPPPINGLSELTLLAAQLFFAMLFLRGALRRFPSTDAPGRFDLLLYVLTLPMGLLVLNYFGVGRTYLERSLFVLQPFFVILVARGATGFRRQSVQRACLVLLGLLMEVTAVRFYTKSVAYSPTPDWKSASAYFARELSDPGPRRQVFVATPSIALTHYNRRVVTSMDSESEAETEALSLVRPSTLRLSLARVFADRYFSRFQEQLKEASAEVRQVSASELSDLLRTQRPEPFYMLRNSFWPGHFDQLMEAAEAQPGFEISQTFLAAGITIYKCRIAPEEIGYAQRSRSSRRPVPSVRSTRPRRGGLAA